jgi:hypothetical protein
MSKSSQARETARVIVNPLFAWSNAVLKGGEMMLDSVAAAARSTRSVRVAALQDEEAPRRRTSSGKAKSGKRQSKGRRRGR